MTTESEVRTCRLADLIQSVRARKKHNFSDAPITSVTDDSRRAQPGALFIAVRGEKIDGHSFIGDAVARGASAVVCQKAPKPRPACPVITVRDSRVALSALASAFYGHPTRDICMVGVTGSEGKTTTTELIRTILEHAGFRAGSLGTVRYNLGGRVVEADQTTPHPISLQAMLREMADGGITHASMEVSSHSLVQRRVHHVEFRVAVLTNVTQDHLDFHVTRKAYIRAKQMLFERLSPDAVAVLNADSPVCNRYRKATNATVLTYGMHKPADVRLDCLNADLGGMNLTIHTPLGTYDVYTPLVGDYNCENILAAATAAFALGMPSAAVRRALERFVGAPGRLERVTPLERSDLPLVFVDFAHTGESLRRVLTVLRPLTRGRLICAFGCGGNRERQKRPVMGQTATSIADFTVITSDNSRNERTEDIIAEIVAGIRAPGARYETEPDRRKAIEKAIAAATSPDDVVAICGRGHEQVQILGDQRIPLDDRVVAREVLLPASSVETQQAPARRKSA